MSLHDALKLSLREATLQRKRNELRVLRMIIAEVKQVQIDQQIQLSDDNIISILAKMVKQRHNSANIFREANRNDLADRELYEINIISKFLPQPLQRHEIADMAEEAINFTSATNVKDMGKVIGQMKDLLKGRADMTTVSEIVREKLTNV